MRPYLLNSSFTILLASLLLLCGLSQAVPVYVDDKILINVRSGKGNEFRIVRNAVKSGFTFELISEEGDWSHVSFPGGDGWVRTQYLTKTPIAAHLLVQSNNKLASLTTKHKQLKSDLRAKTKQLKDTDKAYKSLQEKHLLLEQEFERNAKIAKEPLKIDKLNKTLNEKNTLLRVEIEQANTEVDRLKNDHRNQGISWGAGAVLIGLFIGWLMSKRAYNKQSSWT